MNAGRPNQSIHKVFAENLRVHCARFNSIAELCRLADINRQQFNRYLSGQNLPNPRTLERLSAVLQVSEASLFASNAAAGSTEPMEPQGLALLPEFANLVPLLNTVGSGAITDLRSGYYNCYAPLIDRPGFCVRMLIEVVNDGKIARFTRRTTFKPIGAPQPEYAVGRHGGIILGDVHGALLIGRNRIFPFEFTAFRIQRPAASQAVPRAGLALLRTASADIATRIAVEYLGTGRTLARRAIASLGILEIADPSVSVLVRALITSKSPNYVSAEEDATLSGYRSDE
ncbi:helix-turn-helix domain-containing protein [Aestuariivirga litoralis]|uniref:helix-turn-helix domain-containing protein n=1 Tax=Aestuariivirga litoralis TaxID=2650924 RepID=UPI0018C707EC|nr:helix-turn-helix transcriptional regulator [Aestuariivirga litoralis]MBG1231397.1 helix-turn-helix transcriptional regulator [Aestuariivirga litoralis]